MHIALSIDKCNMLMANDVPEIMGKTNENENRSKIAITAESKEEADRLFNGHSEGGQIEWPIGDSPCGSYFGCFRDTVLNGYWIIPPKCNRARFKKQNKQPVILYIMNIQEQIKKYITSQPEPKRSDMQALHLHILKVLPGCKLWFLDGKDDKGKTVSNPNIGYGLYTIKYADGKTREFYQIGISANTTGITVYVLGIKDKKYLSMTYGKKMGKASVSGYCIKFKTLKDININILEAAIRYGVENK